MPCWTSKDPSDVGYTHSVPGTEARWVCAVASLSTDTSQAAALEPGGTACQGLILPPGESDVGLEQWAGSHAHDRFGFLAESEGR